MGFKDIGSIGDVCGVEVSKGPGMLWNLDSAWLMMAIAFVAVVAFFFGTILDAVMKDDGFGPFGNMIVIAAGFFLGILAINYHGIRLHDLTQAMSVGLSGAFASIAALALLKAGLARLMG